MSFYKIKSNFYCVGCRLYSSTFSISGDTTTKKRNTLMKLLRRTYTTCKRSKSIIVFDKTVQAEGLGKFFTQVGEEAENVGQKTLEKPFHSFRICSWCWYCCSKYKL